MAPPADYEDVCVLVPTYNEAATIADVIDGLHEQGLENVLVVDGHSTDDTREIAREKGARVVEQTGDGRGSGKGQAVREGLRLVEAPYVLMLDGDGTYDPADADALLEPLLAGEAEHVVGDRFAGLKPGAMSRLNRVGNRIINAAFRRIHRRDLGDVLSGYRAFTRESAERLGLSAEGFDIETELSVESVRHNVETTVVPISYHPRPSESDASLHPFRDGGRIITTLYQLAKTNNPLFYFGSVGLVSLLGGGGIGVYVGVEWLTRRIGHEVLAVVSAFTILLGMQLIIFGLLSDMIVSLHREQLRRIRQIETRSGTVEPHLDIGHTMPQPPTSDDADRSADTDGERRPASADTDDEGRPASADDDREDRAPDPVGRDR